jgi:flagellar biogenesis protein FliO
MLAKVLGVFALLGATLWTLKRTHGGAVPTARAKAIEVRGTTRLGKSASVSVLRVQGEELLVGVTEHTVTLLSRRPQEEDVVPAAAVSAPTARSVPELVDLVMTSRADVPSEAIASALLATRNAAPDGSVAPAPDRMDAPTRPEHPWTRLARMSRQPCASRGAGD